MIAARLRQIADRDPGATALISGDVAMSYPELIQAGENARSLLTQKGVQPGDFVMVSLPVSIEAAVILAACAESGAIFFPINLAWRKAELSWLISQAPPAIVIVASDDTGRWLDAGVDPHRIALAGEFTAGAVNHPAVNRIFLNEIVVSEFVMSF
jgi:acyl-CoA synthetase (AMP-forming)/AMP-acid ligase II